MAYSYKCSISFGLVYIPVTLHASVKTQDVGFNMLDKKTMSRVKYKKTCEECDGREVKQEDIVKGYEYEDDKYVVFTEEDFEKLKTKKDKKGIFASECCATGTTRGWYFGDDNKLGYLSAYDKDTSVFWRGREFTWKFLAKHEWLHGG